MNGSIYENMEGMKVRHGLDYSSELIEQNVDRFRL